MPLFYLVLFPFLFSETALLGFFVTVGLISYDQRNTEIYRKQLRRARLLELRMEFPPLITNDISSKDNVGGLFLGRPTIHRKLFSKIKLSHGLGLNIIYSMVLGTWAYLCFASIFRLMSFNGSIPNIVSLMVAGGITIICYVQIRKLNNDKDNREINDLNLEIRRLLNEKRENKS